MPSSIRVAAASQGAGPRALTLAVNAGEYIVATLQVRQFGASPTLIAPAVTGSDTGTTAPDSAEFQNAASNRSRAYGWRVVNTGNITITGSVSGGGFIGLNVAVWQGTPTGSSPVSGAVFAGSSGANLLATVTSAAGDTVAIHVEDYDGGPSAYTPTSPATPVTGTGLSTAYQWMATRAGGASPVAIAGTYPGTTDAWGIAYSVASAVVAPVITGPSGAAGAASSTANLAEVATTGPTFTTSATLGGGYPTLTGADAASFAITALSSTSWRVDPVTPFNFESLPHSNPFNVTFNASASVSQTCAITITNVNEAPGFSGTISVPGLTESVAMSAINAALLFSDPDSGDTGTYSAVGTFPTGVTVSSGGLISGTPGAGTAATYSSLRVRRTDGGGLTADSNVFSITVSASGAPPGVTTQPSNQTVTEGGVATLTAAFSNSPTGFAWEFADTPYSSWSPVVGGSGAATASYTTGALLLANNARRFRCTGTNAFGSTTTNGAAQVTVNAASGLAGFDFHSTVGCRFGAIAGSLVGLAPEVGVSIVIRVYNASTGDRLVTLPAAVTNSSGYLPRATHASLVAATSYTLNAVWPDGAVYAFNLAAT